MLANDEHRFERLRALTEVSRALTYTTSIEQVLRIAVERAAELMRADKAVIMLNDADGLLTVRAAHGIDEQRLRDCREPLDETLVRRLQTLLDYQTEDRFLSVPLVVQGEVTGLLVAVRSSDPPGANDDDEWLLSALGDQAAVALENARLTAAVQAETGERSRFAAAQERVHATLSHELRSPLTTIQSYSSLLLENIFGPLTDRQRESISRIALSGRHLLGVIENVLDVARINAGSLVLASAQTDTADILDEAVQMLQPLATEKQQELRTDVAGSFEVNADTTRLRQALVNLIGNAIKYTPAGGTIAVQVTRSVRDGRPHAAIAITDSGRGIAADLLDAIFEPYERGGMPDHESGIGLGLYISRELIRQMGGAVEVRSEPQHGSTFTVFLPLAEDAPAGD
jgi:phosphoserine phosphatase RsbU/P